MVSMMDILSGASRLTVDVRQTGSRPLPDDREQFGQHRVRPEGAEQPWEH
jgi:hypothetical protein